MKALDTLPILLPTLFGESQRSTVNHRKNAIALRKLQEQCAKATSNQEDFTAGEDAFNFEFARALNKILPLKKKEPCAEFVSKFIASFVQYIQDKDTKERAQKNEVNNQVETEDEETTTSRFVEFLMKHLIKFFNAKDKNVRSRVCQLIALCINSLGEIDDDVYQALKRGLFVRSYDKEASVRLHAVMALSRMQGADDDDDDDEQHEELPVTAKLIDILQYDPRAEVRRAALLNIELSKETLPYILERVREVDAINRRCVYMKLMRELPNFRVLSIEQREKLLDCGLSDRDVMVNKACAKMLAGKWIQDANNSLLEFLECLDVLDSKVAEKVLIAFFQTRPDIFESLTFDDNFWENLTPESAFLVRVFANYCSEINDDINLERALPELTKHAFIIDKYAKLMEENVGSRENDDGAEAEHLELSFIVEQLLCVAVKMDYGDEMGRRKMDTITRNILMMPDLTDGIMTQCVEILRKLSLDEGDFTRIMIETISEIREPIDETIERIDDDEDTMSLAFSDLTMDATPRQPSRSVSQRPTVDRLQRRMESLSLERSGNMDSDEMARKEMEEKLLTVKCLYLTKCMLMGNRSSLQGNVAMYGLLQDIIVPAVRLHDAVIRERGMECLGLCCLLDSDLGLENLGLFFHQVKEGHDDLQVKCLQVIFDMIMAHGLKKLSSKFPSPDAMLQFIHFALQHSNPRVQATACQGTAKLMLSGIIRPQALSVTQEQNVDDDEDEDTPEFDLGKWNKAEELLHILLLLYYDPETINNQPLRQCLSYFFPVYCYSSPYNQTAMQKVFVPTLKSLTFASRRVNDDSKMIPPSQIAQQLVDFTDPRKVVIRNESLFQEKWYLSGHVTVAIQILVGLLKTHHKELIKTYIGILGKLYVPNISTKSVDVITLKVILILIAYVRKTHSLNEVATRNALKKFESAIVAAGVDDEDEQENAELEKILQMLGEDMDVLTEEDNSDTNGVSIWQQVCSFIKKVENGDIETDDDSDVEFTPKPSRRRGNSTS